MLRPPRGEAAAVAGHSAEDAAEVVAAAAAAGGGAGSDAVLRGGALAAQRGCPHHPPADRSVTAAFHRGRRARASPAAAVSPPLLRVSRPLPAAPPPPRVALRLRLAVSSFSPHSVSPVGAGSEPPRHPPLPRRLPGAAKDPRWRPALPSPRPPAGRTAAARPAQRGALRGAPRVRRGPELRERGCSGDGRAGPGGRGLAVWERVCRQAAGAEACLRAAGWRGRLRSRGQGRAGRQRPLPPSLPFPSLDLTGLVPVPGGWAGLSAGVSFVSYTHTTPIPPPRENYFPV